MLGCLSFSLELPNEVGVITNLPKEKASGKPLAQSHVAKWETRSRGDLYDSKPVTSWHNPAFSPRHPNESVTTDSHCLHETGGLLRAERACACTLSTTCLRPRWRRPPRGTPVCSRWAGKPFKRVSDDLAVQEISRLHQRNQFGSLH